MTPRDEAGGLLRKHLTVQNVLLLIVALFGAGQYAERTANSSVSIGDKLKAVEIRLLAAELAAENASVIQQQTYVRRDVIEERLKSMEERLGDIKVALQIRGAKR
jgi:isoaspartyl peptidase/L-asparaginase-like protein (Ntn-hydrolase superfamily)